MPELPEVETMCRGVRGVIGSTIRRAARAPCRKRPIEIRPRIDRLDRRLRGQTITGVERLGKRVVLVTDRDDRLIFEPRMTGLVLIDSPPTQEHLRFVLELDGGPIPELRFWDRRGLGQIHLLQEAEYRARLADGRLGPDACVIEEPELRERLGRSQREIKVALLDQSAVAGIGNLYAAEILHWAGIHPQARCHRLTRRQWLAIHTGMREVLETAIRYEGSTLSDGTYRNALNQAGQYQNEHRVYARTGLPCFHCGEPIRRIVQAQRATFFCPGCQTRQGVRVEA